MKTIKRIGRLFLAVLLLLCYGIYEYVCLARDAAYDWFHPNGEEFPSSRDFWYVFGSFLAMSLFAFLFALDAHRYREKYISETFEHATTATLLIDARRNEARLELMLERKPPRYHVGDRITCQGVEITVLDVSQKRGERGWCYSVLNSMCKSGEPSEAWEVQLDLYLSGGELRRGPKR